jgi:hypothetical protein
VAKKISHVEIYISLAIRSNEHVISEMISDERHCSNT